MQVAVILLLLVSMAMAMDLHKKLGLYEDEETDELSVQNAPGGPYCHGIPCFSPRLCYSSGCREPGWWNQPNNSG